MTRETVDVLHHMVAYVQRAACSCLTSYMRLVQSKNVYLSDIGITLVAMEIPMRDLPRNCSGGESFVYACLCLYLKVHVPVFVCVCTHVCVCVCVCAVYSVSVHSDGVFFSTELHEAAGAGAGPCE